MKRASPVLTAVVLAVFCVVVQQACLAKFAHLAEPVPLARLLINVARFVHDHPGNPEGHYTLGRLESMKFARGVSTVDLVVKDWKNWKHRKPLALPQFPPWYSVREKRNAGSGPLTAPLRQALLESIREYRRAVQLDGRNALYWLGLGWMIEEGAPFAAQIPASFLDRPSIISAKTWLDWSLAAYRKSYALARGPDLAADMGQNPEIPDEFVSVEAGEGVLRLLGPRLTSRASRAEAAGIRASIKKVQSRTPWVTPIIFSLNGGAPESLLDPSHLALFDLRGEGRRRPWTWVSRNAGILVWDPENTGHIVSGRQLFGSETWSMFWKDGYAPLAALDDDRNGWLEGKELSGIAVWFDRNGNGSCDPGEVVSLSDLGIARIAVRADGRAGGMLTSERGIQRRDGSFLPTYDWISSSP